MAEHFPPEGVLVFAMVRGALRPTIDIDDVNLGPPRPYGSVGPAAVLPMGTGSLRGDGAESPVVRDQCSQPTRGWSARPNALGAQLPWYLALLASDLAALSDSSLSLTSWRIKTSESEARTPASVPVDQEVTLAVTRVRISDLEDGVAWGSWRPSPG